MNTWTTLERPTCYKQQRCLSLLGHGLNQTFRYRWCSSGYIPIWDVVLLQWEPTNGCIWSRSNWTLYHTSCSTESPHCIHILSANPWMVLQKHDLPSSYCRSSRNCTRLLVSTLTRIPGYLSSMVVTIQFLNSERWRKSCLTACLQPCLWWKAIRFKGSQQTPFQPMVSHRCMI